MSENNIEATRDQPKTTLQIAAQVDSAIDLGFTRSAPKTATVPRDWSVLSGLVRIAERVTSRSSLQASSAIFAVSRPETADIVEDIELPDEEIAANFAPEPIKQINHFHFFSLLLSIGLLVAIILSTVTENDDGALSFAGVVLVYVAYVAETVMFGPESEYFDKKEQYAPQEGAATLQRFLTATGFIKIAHGINLDIVEFARCLDNSSMIPFDISATSIFQSFESTKALLVLKLTYKYDLFSEREEEYIEQKITDFLEAKQLPNTRRTRKNVRTNVLVVDNHTRSLPRVSTIIVFNPHVFTGFWTNFWLNFWTHTVMTAIGLGFIHRQVMSSFFVDTRTWTCSKVFVSDFDANVEFHIRSFQGGSQFSAYDLENPTTPGNSAMGSDATLRFNSALYGDDEVRSPTRSQQHGRAPVASLPMFEHPVNSRQAANDRNNLI